MDSWKTCWSLLSSCFLLFRILDSNLLHLRDLNRMYVVTFLLIMSMSPHDHRLDPDVIWMILNGSNSIIDFFKPLLCRTLKSFSEDFRHDLWASITWLQVLSCCGGWCTYPRKPTHLKQRWPCGEVDLELHWSSQHSRPIVMMSSSSFWVCRYSSCRISMIGSSLSWSTYP